MALMDLVELFKRIELYHQALEKETGYPGDRDQKDAANDMILAMHAEVDELMRSYNWKPWRKNVDGKGVENMYEEIIDLFFFLGEFMEIWGLSPQVLDSMFELKLGENYHRLNRGYHNGAD
jgi:hypothetical protein